MDAIPTQITLRIELPDGIVRYFGALADRYAATAAPATTSAPAHSPALETQARPIAAQTTAPVGGSDEAPSDAAQTQLSQDQSQAQEMSLEELHAKQLERIKPLLKEIQDLAGVPAVREILKGLGAGKLSDLDPTKYENAVEIALTRINELHGTASTTK